MQCSAANSISKIEQDIKFLKIYSLKVFQSHDNETVNKTMFLYLKKKKKKKKHNNKKKQKLFCWLFVAHIFIILMVSSISKILFF